MLNAKKRRKKKSKLITVQMVNPVKDTNDPGCRKVIWRTNYPLLMGHLRPREGKGLAPGKRMATLGCEPGHAWYQPSESPSSSFLFHFSPL